MSKKKAQLRGKGVKSGKRVRIFPSVEPKTYKAMQRSARMQGCNSVGELAGRYLDDVYG